MRPPLKNLLEKVLIFQFDLPHNNIERTQISTFADKCFKASSNSDVSMLIYNGIIDYALGERNVDFNSLDKEQTRAIAHHMRYEESDDDSVKEKYGFYGEVVLNLLMQIILSSRQIIAKGYFYNPMSSQETHGFDAFHYYYNPKNGITSIVFGEAKFRESQSSAIESAIESMSKVLTVDYLNKNFYAINNIFEKTELMPEKVVSIFKRIKDNPNINVYNFLVENKIKIVYPILIMCNQSCLTYEERIKSLVKTVNNYVNKLKPVAGIDIVIFFIFVPVNNTKEIKKEVIQCISEKKPLM